ncbi:indigoidine synthase A-like protein [Phlebopus sp. FC_14]|nr:indigoidine synthase A-like protein [Phlebopus sp. FC_14]
MLSTTRRLPSVARKLLRISAQQSPFALYHGAPVDVHPEVEDALATGRPVVALESTIITHGMPYPTSLDMAQSVEGIIRSTGSIPATIGLVEGRVKIGLRSNELERLASRTSNPVKLSRRDIATAIALKKDGGTTCSSTLIFAALAGIKVFATGGLGGVHRGGENTMDVSADLQELARCPVGLISAGVKSILDIGRTLEYLETLGVPVVSYAENDNFPAFYTRESGFKARQPTDGSPWFIEDPRTAAQILYTHEQLGMTNGTLFAVPIPKKYNAAGITLQEAVEIAVRESEEGGVSKLGKEATPWLLKRISELTSGKSLESNVALVQNTALVGGQIAVEYATLARERHHDRLCGVVKQTITSDVGPDVPNGVPQTIHGDCAEDPMNSRKASLVVAGSASVDITAQLWETSGIEQKTTFPGRVSMSLGGVARNIAEAAHALLSGAAEGHCTTLLVAPVGEDGFGKMITDSTGLLGMRTDGLVTLKGQRSSVCNLLLDAQGGLQCGVADMDLTQTWMGDEILAILDVHQPKLLAIDGNISAEVLTTLVTKCLKSRVQTFFEPTSAAKSTRILPAIASNIGEAEQSVISFASPNVLELSRMYQDARTTFDLMSHERWWTAINSFDLGSQFRADLEQLANRTVSDDVSSLGNLSFLTDKGIAQMATSLLPFFQHLVIKCAQYGVVVAMRLCKTEAGNWAMERSNPRGRYIVACPPSSDAMVVIQHFPPLLVPHNIPLNSTGAGDSLVGALLAMIAKNPKVFLSPETLAKAIDTAQQAAILTLQSQNAVSSLMSSLRAISHS